MESKILKCLHMVAVEIATLFLWSIDKTQIPQDVANMSPEITFEKQIFDFLMESQFWSQNQMVDYQTTQLSQLLRFAYSNVPFYTQRLAPLFSKSDDINWGNWGNVPILTRMDLLNYRHEMLAGELPAGHGVIAHHEGTGTTGKPVTTTHNSLTAIVSTAAIQRAFDRHKIRYDGVFLQWIGERPLEKSNPLGDLRGPWGPAWHPDTSRGVFVEASVAFGPEQVVKMLVERRVNYISGRPLAMQAIALAAERMGVKHPLAAVSGFGTAASDEMRADCLRVFGAEIISLYASKEVYNIAHQCPESQILHVNAEMVLLEVLDDNDEPTPYGVTGRAVVTSFYNTSQPLIRYDLGDRIIMDEECSCGHKQPVIRQVVGRTAHLFRFPNGRKIAPNMGPDARANLRALAGASSYQIAQTLPNTLELRYVSDGSGREPDLAGLTALFRLHFDSGIDFSCKQIAALPLTASGKFIDYVCELPPEN
jgi:phenylacetate-CoA ligase